MEKNINDILYLFEKFYTDDFRLKKSTYNKIIKYINSIETRYSMNFMQTVTHRVSDKIQS